MGRGGLDLGQGCNRGSGKKWDLGKEFVTKGSCHRLRGLMFNIPSYPSTQTWASHTLKSWLHNTKNA